jgi:RNA polymerase sigma-70 factor (ECF subfamily)
MCGGLPDNTFEAITSGPANQIGSLLAAKDDARDVAQEVFLRAFKYFHRLDLQKPMEPWLIQITINACRDAARQRQRRRDTFVEIDAQPAGSCGCS